MTIYMGQCVTVQQIPSCIIEENVVNMYIASSLWRPELGKAYRNNGMGGELQSGTGDFPPKKNMNLKHLILHDYHFNTHLSFLILGWGTLFSLDLDLNGCSNFKSYLEKPSDKCQRTHIMQNLIHGA